MSHAVRLLFALLACFLAMNAGLPVAAEPDAKKPAEEKSEVDADTLKALSANAVGDYDTALKHAEAALARNPKDGIALAARATVRAKRDKDFKAALKDLEDAMENGCKDVGTHKLKADCHMELSDSEAALKTLRACIELHPKDSGSYTNLGDYQRGVGSVDEAAKSYEKALDFWPSSMRALDGMVRVCLSKDDHKRGLEFSKRLVEVAKWYGIGWYHHGLFLWETGAKAEAERAYIKATEEAPELGEAWLNLGYVRLMTRRNAEALAPAKRAVELMPESALALSNLGTVFLRLDQNEECIRHVSLALQIEPTPERYWTRAAAYKDLNRLAERAEDMGRAAALKPGDADALTGYGEALHDVHRYDLALKQFDAALKMDESHAMAVWCKADALLGMNRAEDALKFLEDIKDRVAGHPRVLANHAQVVTKIRGPRAGLAQVEKIADSLPMAEMAAFFRALCLGEMGKWDEVKTTLPESNNLRVREMCAEILANIAFEQGKLDEAWKICEQALADNGEGFGLRGLLAEIHVERGERAKALAIRRDISARQPYKDAAQRALARALADAGEVDEARETFSAAIRLNPWAEEGYSSRAYFLMQRGDDPMAGVDLDRALELDPRHLPALVNRAMLHLRSRETREAEACLVRAEAEVTRRLNVGCDPVELRIRQAEVASVRASAADANTDVEQAATLRKAAIDHLKEYAKAGRLVRRGWQTSLDFEALREEPEFKALFAK